MTHSKLQHYFPTPVAPCECGVYLSDLDPSLRGAYEMGQGTLRTRTRFELEKEEALVPAYVCAYSPDKKHIYTASLATGITKCKFCSTPSHVPRTASEQSAAYDQLSLRQYGSYHLLPAKEASDSKELLNDMMRYSMMPKMTGVDRAYQPEKELLDCAGCNVKIERKIGSDPKCLMVKFPSGEKDCWCDSCAKNLLIDFAYRRKAKK